MTNPQPQPAALLHWEDFPIGDVREFGNHLVTAEDIVRFAKEFDPQPFHLDEEAAKLSLFKGLCASGWHTCAMAMRMMCDNYLSKAASLGSPGIDNLRWLKPVRPGDILRMRLTVLETRPMESRPTVGITLSRWEVINQHGENVMTMEGKGMFRRRVLDKPV